MAAWAADGGSVLTTRLADPATVDPATVVDVRQRAEFATGHLPGATNVELGQLTDPSASPCPRDRWSRCAGTANAPPRGASLLERAGRTDVAVLPGGPGDWATATGRAVEVAA